MTSGNSAIKELRPDNTGFFKYRLGVFVLICVVVSILLIVGLSFVNDFFIETFGGALSPLWVIAPVLFIIFIKFLKIQAQASKTKYVIYSDRIVYHGGGIFSDFENELNYKNVTRVSMKLPYVENYFCSTGNILIESAGGSSTEVIFSSMSNPKGLYEEILSALKDNGFQLKQENLVQEERPHPLAVFLQTGQSILGAIFVFTILLFQSDEDTGEMYFLPWLLDHPSVMLIGGVVIFIGLIIYGALVYLGLKRRVYRLYDDAIVYYEGFLTKVTSIIPMENLADSSVTQGFISKMFGLYDVKLSCQGSNQEISFLNIANGDELSQNLDKQISVFKKVEKENVSPQIKQSIQQEGESSQVKEVSQSSAPTITKQVANYDQTATLELKMDSTKSWVPGIIFMTVFTLGALIASGGSIGVTLGSSFIPIALICFFMSIRINKTIYRIKESSVESTFEFLHRASTEFSFEKVTALNFKQSWLDRLLGTCSIVFWSIGARMPLKLSNVRISDDVKKMILAKAGIRCEGEIPAHQLLADFSLMSMISSGIGGYIFYAFVLLGVLIFAPVYSVISLIICVSYEGIRFFICKLFYAKSSLSFYDNCLRCSYGLINLTQQYALYEDIKDITTVKFPLLNTGNLSLNIAGEIMLQKAQAKGASPSYLDFVFKFKYVDNIELLDEIIDSILMLNQVTPAQVAELVSKPLEQNHTDRVTAQASCINPLFTGGLFLLLPLALVAFILLFVGQTFLAMITVLFIIFIVVLIVMKTKAKQYAIQDKRVVAKTGLIYKKQITIIFDRIDFINCQQGMLNKMFGNGNITVNTAGSSKPEIIIKNIPNHREFYGELKKVYN